MQRRRVALYVLHGVLVVVIVLLAALVILTTTDWGRERVRSSVSERLAAMFDGRIRIGRVEGNLLRRVRLVDVEIADPQGRPFLRADTLETRFSLRALLRQSIELTDVRLIRAILVLDRPPGEDWNYIRIFRIEPDTVPRRVREPPGWGDRVSFTDIEIVGARLTVRTAWDPPADLAPAEREEALRKALSGDTREHVVAVPGGHQNIMQFDRLDALLPRVLVAHPDSAGIPIEVARFSGIVQPFQPPGQIVNDLAGRFRLAHDSLHFTEVRAVLPGSRMTAQGVYALETGDLLLGMHGDPVAFTDLRWLYPPLPEEGGGSLRMRLEMRTRATRIVAYDMDLHVGDATIAGGIDLTTGDTLRIGPTDVTFARVTTSLVERFAPTLDLPRRGLLTGRLALRGTPAALQLNGDVAFDDAGGLRSRLVAAGGVALEPATRFSELRVRFDPLHASLARAFAPDLPLRTGTFRGALLLNGFPARTLDVSGSVAHHDARLGTSAFRVNGGIGFAGGVRFHDLDVVMQPLRVALVEELTALLPVDGLFTGTARLNGTPQNIAARTAVVHEDRGERSRVTGTIEYAAGRVGRMAADLTLHPLSLVTVGRFAPGAALHGSVSGPARLRGNLNDLRVNADLAVAGGGAVDAAGWIDVASEPTGYDLALRMQAFDLAAVSARAPYATALTGTLTGRGRGFDPATMRAAIRADLSDSSAGEHTADRVLLDVDIANALAQVRSDTIRLRSAEADVQGSFGLTAHRTGELAYRLTVDSLHAFAGILPGTDTAVSPPRPLIAAGNAPPDTAAASDGLLAVVDTPRFAGGSRVGNTLLVADVSQVVLAPTADTARADGVPAALAAHVDTLAADTVPPVVDSVSLRIPTDSLAGRLFAAGTLRGNVTRFAATGTADVAQLVAQGIAVDSGRVEFGLTDVGATSAGVDVDASLHDLRGRGMAFDSVSIDGDFRGDRYGAGRAVVAAYQDTTADYGADVRFTLSLERNELRIADATLRFDTVMWRTARPGVIGWGGAGMDVEQLDLVSNDGGRIFLDGRLPLEGTGNLDVRIENVQVAQLSQILQRDDGAVGLLNLDADFAGTLEAPRIIGTGSLADAQLDGTPIPDVRLTVNYVDRVLTADAELHSDTLLLATAEARLPVDLALAGEITGPRLLPGPISVDIRADSVPAAALPAFTDVVEDVSGRLAGDIRIRGTFEDPVVEGAAMLDMGTLRVVPLGVRLERVAGAITMTGDVVTVDSLVAWSGGPLRIAGTIGVETLARPVFDLNVAARASRVIDTDDANLRVDAAVTITGPLDALAVAGEVHTRRGVIYIPEAADLSDTNVVSLDDPGTYDRMSGAFGEERDRRVRAASPLRNVTMNVSVIIDRDVWLRSAEANVEIYTPPEVGPLRIVRGAAGGLALEGTINTDRGEYEFMSRRFRLSRGAVTFVGADPIDPILQIAAEHEVRLPGREAFQIRVVLGGTMSDLTIALESSSQPPISQSDLISYLAFGRDASSLLLQQGSGLSGADGAGALVGDVAGLATQQLAAVALSAAVDQLEYDAMRSLRLDVFRITPADLPAEVFTGSYVDVIRGTEIEAGRYVTPRWFVAGQVRPQLVRPGLRFEYGTPRGLRWQTSWQPRYLPLEPTLGAREPRRASVFGSFLFREWRF